MKTRRNFLFSIFILECFTLATQFYLSNNNTTVSITESIIRYFSYFTILTNILVAFCTGFLLLKPSSFFSKQSTQTAIAIYIFIVGLIYNVILRFTWHPQGLSKIIDELLHVVNPVLYIIYWVLFSNKQKLKWKNIFSWLIYPLVYIIYVLIRGESSGFYPYPFLEVNRLGFNKVLVNCASITTLFILTSIIFLTTGNFIASKRLKSREEILGS